MTEMYVVLQMERFDLEVTRGPKVPVEVDAGKMVGFLPVFENLEDLRAEYPEADYAVIQEKGVK